MFSVKNAPAVIFAKKEQLIPNIEFKFVKDDVDYYSLTEAMEVMVRDTTLNISPLELQIAYKCSGARRMIWRTLRFGLCSLKSILILKNVSSS